MKRAIVERNLVVILFVLVLVVFSFAERDSKKLDQLYSKTANSFYPQKEKALMATEVKKVFVARFVRN